MLIYFSEISGKSSEKIDNLLKFVSKKKRDKLARYRYPIDRKLGLYTDLLVRKYAMQYLGLENSEIEFEVNEYGKPFILGHTQLHFNISHTRNAIAVVFSSHEVGIDIEKLAIPDYAISKRFFTSREYNYILSHKKPGKAFYEIWTKKEAYTKYIGTGLVTSLSSFDVLDNKSDTMIFVYEVGEYIVAYCCKKNILEEHTFVILTEEEILRLFFHFDN